LESSDAAQSGLFVKHFKNMIASFFEVKCEVYERNPLLGVYL